MMEVNVVAGEKWKSMNLKGKSKESLMHAYLLACGGITSYATHEIDPVSSKELILVIVLQGLEPPRDLGDNFWSGHR